MPPRNARGGSIRARGDTSSQLIHLNITVTGLDKTTDGFKQIRRDVNKGMRDAMQRAGEREVVPLIVSRIPKKKAQVKRGLPTGAMAASIYVQRDRLDVFIGSRLRGKLNRALGWLDFGGVRPRDTKVRTGTAAIISSLNDRSDELDKAALEELRQQFADFDFRAAP